MTTPNDFRITPEQTVALTLDSGPWLSCDDCFELVDQYVQVIADGAGMTPTLQAVFGHLQGCVACDEEAQSLLSLVSADRDETAPNLAQSAGDDTRSPLNRDDRR